MQTLEKLRDMLMEELDQCADKDHLTSNSLDYVDKLTHAIKSIDTIMAMEEAGYSNDSSYAYAQQGRRGNVRRDSMGRYSNNSYDGSYGGSYRGSYRRGGSYRGYSRNERGYSRDDAKAELMEQLRDMSMDADGEHKQMIDEWIRQIEQR